MSTSSIFRSAASLLSRRTILAVPSQQRLCQPRYFAAAAGLDKSVVTDRVLNVIQSFHKVGPSVKVTPESTFSDLGLDSLDSVEVVLALEDEFTIEIPDAEAEKIQSASDAVKYIASNPEAK
eukprot:TRINITY_DN5314_c0_g1_i1.p2 TRINITY_DN5314_c0_g1~~TRINITY_DN5314_c0_g1_i1.p2  ORF type:complete len:122 (-),score=9.92 TRINITY_DN5314_c0_g1_i1:221-586(-)